MKRIESRFRELQTQKRKALIPYITAGDPSAALTLPLMHAMVEAGADILELGIPFSDPMADGPVIQAACDRALKQHITLRQVLALVKAFRHEDPSTPVVLMGYLNPIEVMGYERFAQAAFDAGVDGVLTVDLPPEEAHDLVMALNGFELDPIFLISPTSRARRIELICQFASGFVYYVSLKGVTGANALDMGSVARKLAEIREYATIPIGVGFGIKDAASAAQVAKVADAVIVGSALVRCIEVNADNPAKIETEISTLLRSIRKSMDRISADEYVAEV